MFAQRTQVLREAETKSVSLRTTKWDKPPQVLRGLLDMTRSERVAEGEAKR